jgi:hypothetical protein
MGGTCVAPAPVQLGQACGFVEGKVCGTGLRCGDHDDNQGTPNECFAPLGEGDTCDPQNNLCDLFLNCDDVSLKCRYDYTGTCPAP